METTGASVPWGAVSYERLPWNTDPDDLAFMSKTARRRIGPEYEAAIPAPVARARVDVPSELSERMADVVARVVRFDAEARSSGFGIPAILLRSESAASSQIENLTSSARNVALAELYPGAPRNARLIAGNIAAMRKALELPDDFSTESLLAIHAALFDGRGGFLRTEQVWVGGSGNSPHGALFVPPAPERVPGCLDDLARFIGRDDVPPLAKAAIAHAQLETIHPFIDGNGRTGRTLLHKMLRRDGVLAQATLPVSAGLLHDIDPYMSAIADYQSGDAAPIVERLCDALDVALFVGRRVSEEIELVVDGWRTGISERKGASIHRLPALLAAQPVVNSAFVAKGLGITTRAATTLIGRACDYGMLRPLGNRLRGEFYQADRIVAVLEEVSSVGGIRRMLGARRPGPR